MIQARAVVNSGRNERSLQRSCGPREERRRIGERITKAVGWRRRSARVRYPSRFKSFAVQCNVAMRDDSRDEPSVRASGPRVPAVGGDGHGRCPTLGRDPRRARPERGPLERLSIQSTGYQVVTRLTLQERTAPPEASHSIKSGSLLPDFKDEQAFKGVSANQAKLGRLMTASKKPIGRANHRPYQAGEPDGSAVSGRRQRAES